MQTVFLDFDGEEINTGIFGGPGVRDLSPFATLLGRWDLTAADEDAVEDAIVAEVRENLRRDLRRKGANPNVAVRLRTSDDDRDRFGQRNWSRVIVGGTIEESGIATIGSAQSIDPGNYGPDDAALVLLDVLSGPAGAFGDASLNSCTVRSPMSSRSSVRPSATSPPMRSATSSATGTWTSSTTTRT